MDRFKRWVGLALVLVAACVGGCSSQAPVFPVQGKITFEGMQFKGGGAISFVPLGTQPGPNAGGEISLDGTYRLSTHTPGDGSMAGDFRVVILQVTETEAERTPDGKKAARPTVVVPPAERIPLIYADHQNSPLTAKVEAKSLNEINIDLKRR